MSESIFMFSFMIQSINVRHLIVEVFVMIFLYVCSSLQCVEFP